MDLDSAPGLHDLINSSLNGTTQVTVMLREAELRRMGRSMASHFPGRGDDWKDGPFALQALLDRLLRTAEEPRLTAAHRAASCNALAAFLEQASELPVSELRTRLLSDLTMARAFHSYLKRSGDSQSKPMRQLLRVLVKLLLIEFPNELYAIVIHDIIKICLSHISSDEDSSCVKAAMTVVTMFVQKRLISVQLLLADQSITSLRTANKDQFVWSRFDSNTPQSISSLFPDMSGFISQLIKWLQYADTGPAAGRLILSLVESINDAASLEDSQASSDIISSAAMLADLVLGAVHQRPELIDNLEQHLLPELLRMNPSYTEQFLRSLPIRELCRSNIGCLTEADLRLCLVAIRVVEELGVTTLLDTAIDGLDLHDLSYTQHASTDLLAHDSAGVRILALRSATFSSSSIMPLPSCLLLTLRQVLPCFHAETDSATRNEFCSIVKKLFSRIQAVMHRLTKTLSDLQGATTPSETSMNCSLEDYYRTLHDHVNFLSWYVELLQNELHPTASYPRHISALKVLQLLNTSGLCSTIIQTSLISFQFQYSRQLFESYKNPIIFLLLELVMDPFDDVRSISASLLHEHYLIVVKNSTISENTEAGASSYVYGNSPWGDFALELVLQRSTTLSRRTGRADYADGVGRLNYLQYLLCGQNGTLNDRFCGRQLLFEKLMSGLENDVQVAHDDLQTAIASAPLHGHLIALRYIISHKTFFQLSELGPQNWRRMHDRLVHCCLTIWDIVKDVICYDSPEGHIVLEAEEDESEVNVRDVLSYSWRALKETSALIHTMISNFGYSPLSCDGGLSCEDLKNLGDLTFTQLAELRHRGAFSTVSQTFLAFCLRSAASEDSKIAELPGIWYQETLKCIEAKATALTRRSAGLPAMMTGILAAYPNDPFFDKAMLDLQEIANTPVVWERNHVDIRLSQVHALNCLKDIFTNSRLGSSTEMHLSTTMVIAVNCLENSLWAIRNCGLMLLKALLTRLVGGTGKVSRPGCELHSRGSVSRTMYEKHEVLADLVLRLLQHQTSVCFGAENVTDTQPTGPQHIQMVFPAMEIIERIGVAASHELLVERLLLTHLNSPVWNLRDKAAMILSGLIGKQALFADVSSLTQLALLQEERSWNHNALHGRLLCLKYMIEGQSHALIGQADIKDFIDTLDGTLGIRQSTNITSLSVAVLLDVECSTVEKLLNAHLRDGLRPGGQCAPTENFEYVATKLWRDQEFQDTLQTWKHSVRDLFETISSSRMRATDSFVSALARARVLSALLEDSVSEPGLITLRVLRKLNKEGSAAVRAGIQCFNSMHQVFDPLQVQPLQIYVMLLQQVTAADSRILLMEGLSVLLSSQRPLDRITELLVPPTSMTSGDEDMYLVSWKQQREMTDPRTVNATLKLRGALLAYECETRSIEDSRLKQKLEMWTRMLRLAGNVNSEVPNRLAAVTSIDCFKKALRPETSELCSASAFLGIYLALYDFLLDDEEEVRRIGALVVSWMFSSSESFREPAGSQNISLCPMVAVDRLMSFLMTAYHDSNVFLHEALSRLTGSEPLILHNTNFSGDTFVFQGDFMPPVRELFDTARREDTSLFVEEKQNLYIDLAQESQRWASVLRHIFPTSVEDSMISSLTEWAVAGLKCFVGIADQETGGPLGWMTKPEVFTLGIQVLETARVLRTWENGGLIPQTPGLESIMTRFKRADIHPVWLSRVQEE